jgi:DNA polymerase I-like protein with 3'-5' exonuclease and polymerase domains
MTSFCIMEGNPCAHDEILLEAPIPVANEVALILKERMEEAGRSFLKVVPVEAEVAIADSWAEKSHLLLKSRS